MTEVGETSQKLHPPAQRTDGKIPLLNFVLYSLQIFIDLLIGSLRPELSASSYESGVQVKIIIPFKPFFVCYKILKHPIKRPKLKTVKEKQRKTLR